MLRVNYVLIMLNSKMLHIRDQIQIQIQIQIVIHFSRNSLLVAMWVSHVAKVLAAMALIKLTKRR